MAQYRKRPLIIEAYQVTRKLLEEILFDGQKYPEGLNLESTVHNKESRTIDSWRGSVITVHGQATDVIENDWIITEPDGIHHYPCKPDIFEKTYEKV